MTTDRNAIRLAASAPHRQGRCAWLIALAGLLAAGCTPAEIRAGKPRNPAMERLDAIAGAYGKFNFEKGRPPTGPNDLSDQLGPDALVSPRDGEPFVIFWGANMRSPQALTAARPILGHEKQGRDGSRYVLTMTGHVELLTEDELRDSTFPPGHKAP